MTDLLPGQDRMEAGALARLLSNALLFAGLMSFKGLSYRQLFHDSASSVKATLALTLVPVLALVPTLLQVGGWVDELLQRVLPMSAAEAQAFADMGRPSPGAFVLVCVLAPVLEEMLFRGVILRSFLKRYTPGVAIVHSAAIFGLAHLNVYQFAAGLIGGVALGWIYERTRSLWPCIALHAAYNVSVTLLAQSGIGSEADAPASTSFAWVALLSGGFGVAWLVKCLGWPGGTPAWGRTKQ
ncbi:CPBP family intramembrane metalloprotease [Aquabacterium sp. A7-Y]|uniref:CPBP family intramembrane glutamic endopeptidase n=1 Tax=Aquabacterium sp. A7-Y TaxID=1349605 RepID=UPI00223D07D5|nr:CPBP family intramembrane glutamic endopeptidase [Aquabacterium sp. A7-Y]MCW7538022.1 CPBP family intramembrane metalloprotease [Aquabacterium sp. A7-Y]